MAKYFKQGLTTDATVPKPAYEPFEALRPARKGPLISLYRAQDRVVTMGRRVMLTQSTRGCAAWMVVDTDPAAGSQTHPLETTVRVTARGQCELTPGNMLRLSVLCGLSGQTQRVGGAAYVADGAGGTLRVSITWTNSLGATESTTHDVPLPASGLEFAASNDGTTGGQWKALRVVEVTGLVPEAMITNAVRNEWTLGTTVDITLSNLGGTRVLDACISEEPFVIAYEADDTSARWMSHMLGNGDPAANGPAISHPFQRLSETSPDGDPRGGTWHLQDVANNQALRLGPTLISWYAFDEDDYSITGTDVTSFDSTSSSFSGVPNTSITSYSTTGQGWDIGAAAYARPYRHNHTKAVGNDGVVPVRFRVWASATAGTVGVVRIQSAVDSYVDATITGTGSYAWHTAYGYLRCGTGPGDPATTMAFMRRSSGAGTVSVRGFTLYRSGNFSTAI